MQESLVPRQGSTKPRHRKPKEDPDPHWNDRKDAWETVLAQGDGRRVFFDHLEIARDGGLSEIGHKEEIWYPTRYISSIIVVVFVFYNMYFLLLTDLTALIGGDANEVDFLLSKAAAEYIFPELDLASKPKKVICAIELLMLLWICIDTLLSLIRSCCCTGYVKWSATAELFWENIPSLSTFSCIKLLQYVASSQLSYDLSYILFYDYKVWKLVWFFISRPLALAVGLDCFLMKYRQAQLYIMTDDLSLSNVMGAIILLNQVIGVVNITKTIKNRLYRFVFAGEDGIMTEREKVRQDVWEAMVARNIFERYPRDKALAIMCSWCDDDFQMLALNEDVTKA